MAIVHVLLQCQNCTSAGDGWNSELMVIDKGARNATLRWNPDSTAMNVSYVVEYLEEGTFAVPIRSEPVSFVMGSPEQHQYISHTCMYIVVAVRSLHSMSAASANAMKASLFCWKLLSNRHV